MTESAPGGAALAAAFRRSGLPLHELWLRYLALGGNLDEMSVAAQLHGVLQLPAGEYNVLAHTLNEALDDLPDTGPRVPHLPVESAEDPSPHGC